METHNNCFDELINKLETTLISELNECDKVFIIPHKNMDFDAIASAVALSDVLSSLGIESYIVTNDKPDNMKPSLREAYLRLADKYSFINTDEMNAIDNNKSLLVVVDSCVKNLLPVSNIDSYGNRTIVIDHHKPDNKVINCDKLFISEDACSASEIMFYLLKNMGLYISEETAQLLLAGIYLDTKGLYYVHNPSGFQTVTKLLQYGANLQDVQNLFTVSNFEDDIKQKESVINLVKCTKFFNDNDSKRYAITFNVNNPYTVYSHELLADACDSLLQYNLDAAFVIGFVDSEDLGEGHSNKLAIKARSKINGNNVDVSEIMQLFNGGGDSNRAAATLNTDNIRLISDELKRIINPTQDVRGKAFTK